MLLTELLCPGILDSLAGAGHGAHVLLAGGHYPAGTATGERARTVHLNLAPGLLDITADTRTYANLLLTIGVRAGETLGSQ